MSVRVHHRIGGYSPRQVELVLGISARSIKHLIDSGILTPTKTPGGHRRFDSAQVARVEEIIRVCSSCGGVCFWHDTAWVCDECGDEWDRDHDPRYEAPGGDDKRVYAPDNPRHPANSEFEDWIAGMSDEEYAVWLAGITKLRETERRERGTR